MLTIDQIKLIGIPKNTSRLNNRLLTPAALPNDSVNLYQAVKLIIEDLNIGSSSTDLSINIGPTTISLDSSTGVGVILPSATTTNAGVMSATDKSSLDALITLSGMGAGSLHLGQFTGAIIPNNVDIKVALQALETAIETVVLPAGTDLSSTYTLNDVDILSSTGAGTTINAATASNAGVMVAADKVALDAHKIHWLDLDAIIGVSVTSGQADLGSFAGTTISDNVDIKTALQELETAVESFSAADGNGIYSGSGSISGGTIATASANFALDTDGTGTLFIGDVLGNANSIGMIIAPTQLVLGATSGSYIGTMLFTTASTIINSPTNNADITIGASGVITFNTTGPSVIDDGNSVGIVYAADYSANYTPRSLVDKAYVDGITGVTTDITITQSNNAVTVNSSSGADGTIVSATSSTAGVLTSGDKRKLDALVTLSGVPTESVSLGTFTGTIIPDSRDIKTAFQDIETYLMNLTSAGGYAYTNGPSYTLSGTTRTVYAEATGSNINISAGSQLTEGEVYYLYTRRDLSFGITITPAATYSLFVTDGNIGAETITTPYTVPHGSGQNIAFMLQRRGSIIFLTRLA